MCRPSGDLGSGNVVGRHEHVSAASTVEERARELGADLMMFGSINSTVDSYQKEKVVSYKVNMELVELQSTEKVWIGDKEIKKYVKN